MDTPAFKILGEAISVIRILAANEDNKEKREGYASLITMVEVDMYFAKVKGL